MAYLYILLILNCFLCFSADAAYVLKEGKLVNAEEVATLSPERHYEIGLNAYQADEWNVAIDNFRALICSYPSSPYAQEAYFFLGIAYFYTSELDFANDAFTQYLKQQNNPRYFEETIEYKFAIAERFRCGARKRFLGTNKLPKWASGRQLGLTIYDEVITALPASDIAARALYSKGLQLWDDDCYRESIESFQTLIRRFPKHELAPEAYIAIADVYVEQSDSEFQNPDLLALAGINYRRFVQDFPRDERLCVVEERVQTMKENYAQGLYEIGRFYERKDKPGASIIYYKKAIKNYPDTSIALCCRERLFKLNCPIEEIPEVVSSTEAI